MARPVEYDKQFVLQKALECFWMKGYEGTSVADLLMATGLTSRSMYNTFGSKNGLFKEALQKYYQRGVEGPIKRLKMGKGRAAVQMYLRQMTLGQPMNGCMFVNTLSEKNLIEEDCLTLVKDHFINLESLIQEKLEWSVEHEGYSGDPALRARQLVVMLQGIALYTKTGVPLSEMQQVVEDLSGMFEK